jgi:hypothetical protein
MTAITPNPYSPYADAEPGKRHLFAIPVFVIEVPPQPGELLPTGCGRLAVVPDDVRETTPDAAIPDGVCERCTAALRNDAPLKDDRPLTPCAQCARPTSYDGLCTACRYHAHEQWWAEHGGGRRP